MSRAIHSELVGIQILRFASRSKSQDFYECGHKNLTNNRDQHLDPNPKNTWDNKLILG